MNPNISVSKAALAAFCQERGIRRLAMFGPEDNIERIVEFEPNRIPGLLGVVGMEIELPALFAGRKVDLRTAEDLSPYFRQDVLDRAEVQYAQG